MRSSAKQLGAVGRSASTRSRGAYVVLCAAAMAMCSAELSRTAAGQETYVKIVGSTSTGLQQFAGKNGQIRLPAGSLPISPSEGFIQNVSGTGLMVYHSGAWQLIGAGSAGSGVYVQQGATPGTTVTAISFTGGMTAVSSGTTATISPTYGVSESTVMQGNQALDGEVQGAVGSTVFRPGHVTPVDGDQIVGDTAGGSGGWHYIGAGTPGYVWMQGATFPGWAAIPTATITAAGSVRNAYMTIATTQTVTITADQIDMVNASGEISSVSSFSKVPSIAVSGALGLDTGAVTIDKKYAEWCAQKPDKSATTAFFSLSEAAAGVTPPSGYSGGYFRRVGWIFTKHTVPQVMDFFQLGGQFTFTGDPEVPTTSDGCKVLTSGTSTTPAAVDCSSRVPTTARFATLHVVIVGVSTQTAYFMSYRPSGAGNEQGYVRTVSTAGQFVAWQIKVSLSSSQKYDYATLANNQVNVSVLGYEDNI